MPTRKPDQRLKNQVASIEELQAMSTAELKARTCRTCLITYRTVTARKQCNTHHLTG